MLTLSSEQQALLSAGYAQFVANVDALNATGTFQPTTPPPATTLPKGALTGTIEVSLGTFRGLSSVFPSQSGLPLPGIGNFDGRIDLGFVIDRDGNFGLAITVRGPLSGVPKGVASSNVIGGDIRSRSQTPRADGARWPDSSRRTHSGRRTSRAICNPLRPLAVHQHSPLPWATARASSSARYALYRGHPAGQRLCVDPGIPQASAD